MGTIYKEKSQGSIELETARSGSLLEGFQRLFPKLDTSRIKSPALSEIVLSICSIVQYAFEAYKNPTSPSFTEELSQGQCIQHLNYELTNEAVDGVLKICLKEAKNVGSSFDWSFLRSDPFVLFSAGSTCVRSEVILNSRNPKWNSTHYLVLRKNHLRANYDGKLHISLLDEDAWKRFRFWKTDKNKINQADHLGSAAIDINQLKKPGTHEFNLEMKSGTRFWRDSASLHFTTEFISFNKACQEMDVSLESPTWMFGIEAENHYAPIASNLSWLTEFGNLRMYPFAFIDVPDTDTQAWLLVNHNLKTLLVSFRGTETSKFKDILTDLSASCQQLRSTVHNHYIVKATDELKDEGIKVHSGFLKSYESIREAILQVIHDITGWSEDWNVCLTGHSLGGALATLCAFECKNRKNADGKGPVIGMMNFGAPRVGNAEFARIYDETVVDSFRVVDENDVVHMIPPFYTHSAREVNCLPSGDIYVDGELLNELDPLTLRQQTRNRSVESEDSEEIEEAFREYGCRLEKMVQSHLKDNYVAITKAAAKKFFGRYRDKAQVAEV